jgi:hypothetical protein
MLRASLCCVPLAVACTAGASSAVAQPDRDLGALVAPLIGGLVVVAFAVHAFMSGRRHGADTPDGDEEAAAGPPDR